MKENIDEIINNFNFGIVHKVMSFSDLDWRWYPLYLLCYGKQTSKKKKRIQALPGGSI